MLHAILLVILSLVGWTITRPEPPPVLIELGPTEKPTGGPSGGGATGATPRSASAGEPQAAQAASLAAPTPTIDLAELLPAAPSFPDAQDLGESDPALALLDKAAELATAGGAGQAGSGSLLAGTSDGFRKQVGGMRSQGLDIVFVLDATESMTPYIEQAKQRLREVVGVVRGVLDDGEDERRKSNIRFGVVAFKDYGDEYGVDATESLPLTEDAEQVIDFINNITAGGGGDIPEPLHEALRAAADRKMGWRRGRKSIMVLVGDSPVHSLSRTDALKAAAQFARSMRGNINVLDTGGSDRDTLLPDLQQIARQGQGTAFLLTDEAAFWQSLIVSIFGREYEQDVQTIVNRYAR